MFCFGGSGGPRGFQTPASSCKSKWSLFTRSVSVWETFSAHPNTDGVSSNRRELCRVPYVQETQHIKKLNHLIMCLKFKFVFLFFLSLPEKPTNPPWFIDKLLVIYYIFFPFIQRWCKGRMEQPACITLLCSSLLFPPEVCTHQTPHRCHLLFCHPCSQRAHKHTQTPGSQKWSYIHLQHPCSLSEAAELL